MLTVIVSHVEGNIADHIAPFDLTDYSALDYAFEMGRTAALEADGFADVFPPADMTPAEARAFREGSVVGFMVKEFEIDDARDSSLDEWQIEELYEEWRHRNGLDYEHGGFGGHDANEAW